MTADGRATVILNVNHDPGGRAQVTDMLRATGFEVIEADSGSRALELAAKERPAVAVIDVRLVDISGYEVCRRLKADPATAAVSVIETSATFVTSEGKARGLDSGADAYLIQPFESVELVAMVRSLLRLRHSESESRQHAAALAEADRRKDEFLAMLAHELRNPLSAILTATNVLERVADHPEEVRRLGATVARQSRHLGRLLDDLLDVSRITRGTIDLRRAPVDLRGLVQQVVQVHRPATDKRRQSFTVETPETPVWVEGDATRLDQVLGNLVGNASKYTDVGGHITLELATEQRPDGAWATIQVRDDGIGIEPPHLSAVWDLFYQVPTGLAHSQGGLGIGLTLVRKLVEMHGGRIAIKSDGKGAGTEIDLRLPLTDGARAASDGHQRAALNLEQPLRLLLVDDNVDSCELYKVCLEGSGHVAELAHDGERALELAASSVYDVAMIDIGLPMMDGYQLARRLRLQAGRVPYLIALTGYGRPEDRQEALQAGFDIHLVKPVDVAVIERLLERVAVERRGDGKTPA